MAIAPRRVHLARLMAIWRSAGWPCRDAIELDLVAAGWVATARSDSGHETLRLSDAGIRLLAEARQRNQRSASAHDRLAERMARELMAAGRVVWRELSLRSRFDAALDEAGAPARPPTVDMLWSADAECDVASGTPTPLRKAAWRVARPDVFSVRNTSVEAYLHPMVHEVKASRADLLSDLRHAAKRASYRWLSCETYYVFPAGVAELSEIPEVFGVWLLDGDAEHGRLELARPARHADCTLPFPVWMALARSAPAPWTGEAAQGELGNDAPHGGPCAGDTADPA